MARLAPLWMIGVVVTTSLGAAACGAGEYGHSRTYTALSVEASAADGAVEYDPVMAKRRPEDWQQEKLSVFGIVLGRQDLEGGAVMLKLSMRRLEGRNLCESREDSSCRTTVSEHEHERMHVRVTIANAEDAAGGLSIGGGSLVRVIGTLDAKPNADDGKPVLTATYYRHWPRGYYVTSAASKVLRR